MDEYDPHGGRAYTHRRADAITAEFMDVGVGTEGGREIARLPVVEGEYNREESPRRVWDNLHRPASATPRPRARPTSSPPSNSPSNQVNHYVKKLGAENHAGGGNWIFSDDAAAAASPSRSPAPAARSMPSASPSPPTMRSPPCGATTAGQNHRPLDLPRRHQETALRRVQRRARRTLPQRPVPRRRQSLRPLPLHLPRDRLRPRRTQSRRHPRWPDRRHRCEAHRRRARRPPPHADHRPGGLLARDGSDIALFDAEALDAQGQRCPTVEQRVDFTFTGPGRWRGGYDSGKIDSTNNLWVDLEAGINRVAVRAGRTPRQAHPSPPAAPVSPRPPRASRPSPSPAPRPSRATSRSAPKPRARTITATAAPAAKATGPIVLGKFIKTLNYTAPNAAIVHVEVDARPARAPTSMQTRPSPRSRPLSSAPTGCKPTTATPPTALWTSWNSP